MNTDSNTASGRAFVRSLNILLKFARLYGFDHAGTAEHLETAFRELQAAISPRSEDGLLIGATGSQLLLAGVPMEGSLAEKQFATLLSTAGLASVQFLPSITREELGRFVQAFPTGKAKPSELAQQLKATLAGMGGIRANEVCFIATDSRLKGTSMAAQMAATAVGGEQNEFKSWLSDPQKLLQLMAAAQGAKDDSSSTSPATTGGSRQNPFGMPGGPVHQSEDEIFGILSALTSLGQISSAGSDAPAGGQVQERLSQLPGRAQDILKQALAGLAAQAPDAKPGEAVLVRLAEHLAIRFALERYERGDVKVNAVRQMLDRMNAEIENLRKVLGAHEEKMTSAGLLLTSRREILDEQFWAGVPARNKRDVLLSEEAWCIPPRNVQSYVAQLLENGNTADAIQILKNYAACTDSEDPEARKRSAAGLSELAELYGKADPRLLSEALRHLGWRLTMEQDAERQTVVSAAFVRFCQEAAAKHFFPAMEQALDLIAGVEAQRPGISRLLRTKIGIEERVPEFVDEALRTRQVASGLTNVLKQLPQVTMEQLAARFNRSTLREDAERIANLAADLGEEGLQYLRGCVRGGPAAEAIEMVGLLSKLDSQAVDVFLPGRITEFPRASQDRIIRQISASAAPGRCGLLLSLLDRVDLLVMPLLIDEIGVTADRAALGRLLTIADGDLPDGAGPFVMLKAIEALGRIHAAESVTTLKRIAESKKMFGWAQAQELRIAALQALVRLEPDWVREFLPNSGLRPADLALAPLEVSSNCKFVRQRRHARVRLRKPVTAYSTILGENCRFEIKTASLTGGVATIDRHVAPGTQVQLKLHLGMRSLHATALTRDYRAQGMAFEFMDMNLEERGKFRRLLSENLSQGNGSPHVESTAAPSDPPAAN
jgi:hypothetical protein